MHLGLGENDRVINILESAAEPGLSFQPYLWPEYEALFPDPRFQRALQRLGLPLPSQ